jgi:glutathione S-transferase
MVRLCSAPENRMKLYSSPASPFARKARVIAHLLSLQLEEIDIDPRSSVAFRSINPLAKIPALVLDDGNALFDSPVICEYLDHKGGGKFFPKAGLLSDSAERWRALHLQALADGVADAAVAAVIENRLPEEKRNTDAIHRHLAAIEAGLDALNAAAAKFADDPTIGEISAGCALGYLDFRTPGHDWRKPRHGLTKWYQRFLGTPAMVATMPRNLS